MAFNHNVIEQKWQTKWNKHKCFKAEVDLKRPKFYALSMFPYPSGKGLHVGHLASYTPTEIVARYKRCKGFNVLHPMGYDAFGLPAEQYAIQTGIHPSIITSQAIDHFKKQLQSFGYSFCWDSEISTCDPSYYKWTQYLFLKFFNKGLAYQKKTPVNWCPALKTILANEEVINGRSERGGHIVIKKSIPQWLLSITKYTEKLLQDLSTLDWSASSIEGQINWIGKSQGVCINFLIKNSEKLIDVFTTRPDTLFGVSFIVIAPEHPLILQITTQKYQQEVKQYQQNTLAVSDKDRKSEKNKTGVFTGAYALNPFTKKECPIWTADYVLTDYGTGAIMAVPAHDERDFEFAKKFNLPIKKIMECKTLPFTGDSLHINSEFLNGMDKKQAIQKITEEITKQKIGNTQTQYKLKDWIFSRQRYWGEPLPIVHFKNKTKGIDVKDLPVTLPKTTNYKPSDKGESPLARQHDFINYTDPKTGEVGKREDSTMPGSAASSWYFLRYTDPKNTKQAFSYEKQKYWMPVDLYVGGAEHTVGHLLYARFWQKFLYDINMVSHKEPFKKLVHQGMILGEDNQKMSKSRGNTANPDILKDKYGADTLRVYITFLGPLEKDKPWSPQGIEGSRRFLERIYRLCFNEKHEVLPEQGEWTNALDILLNRTIKKVTHDIEQLSLNTAISTMMIFVNELYRKNIRNHKALKILSQLLMPFAPHICEEIWEALGEKGFVSLSTWPSFKESLTNNKQIKIGVQINGKIKGTIWNSNTMSEADALKETKKNIPITNALKNKKIKKIIYKAGRILNILVE